MRTGVILPSFRDRADDAVAVAHQAERLGLDGAFCYDHIWPMGQAQRPALAPFPLLGALATTTERLALGTLVARVGLVPDDVLVAEFSALALLAPGRVVAALGTGDRLSAAENLAYGVPFSAAATRRASLQRCARTLADGGLPVWIGGGAPATVAVAGEERVAVNLWAVAPAVVARQATRGEVTWAGPAPGSPGEAAHLLAQLEEAGAAWVVFAWPAPLEVLARRSEG